jgi:hypothetical protein
VPLQCLLLRGQLLIGDVALCCCSWAEHWSHCFCRPQAS